MEIPRQYYTEEFKQEAVKLIRESGLKLSEAANRLNIPSQTLKNWLYRDKIPVSTATTLRKPMTDHEAEVSRLRKELAESRLEAEILKKAMAYFAKESLPGTRR
jgi:transposase